jgi:nucleotide-binding universal stress UspA family protein
MRYASSRTGRTVTPFGADSRKMLVRGRRRVIAHPKAHWAASTALLRSRRLDGDPLAPHRADMRPFSILLCFDDTEASGYAFEQAAHIARRIPSSEIHLVDVMSGEPSEEQSRQLSGRLRAYVDAKAASIGGMDGQSVAVHVRYGDAMREIAQLAAEIDIDLIVLGSPKHPYLQALLPGSFPEKLLQHAPCPVLVAGPKPLESIRHHPAIEPPCPACAKMRASTRGAEWWCARHTPSNRQGLGAHVYSYQREIPFATHDSAVTPTGID